MVMINMEVLWCVVYNVGGLLYYWLDMIEGCGDGFNLDDFIVIFLYKVIFIYKCIIFYKFYYKVFIFLFFFIFFIKV